MKKSTKKEIRAWLILGALQLGWIIPISYAESIKAPVEVEDEWIEEYEDVIRWRIDDTDVDIEPLELEPVTQPLAEPVEEPVKSLGKFKLTAYCPCKKCTSDGDGITDSGTVATQGRTVAVDPRIIPYGTVLIIDGHEYIAEDCGIGKEKVWIEGNEIDIFFDDHEEALEFGIQYAEVFICH